MLWLLLIVVAGAGFWVYRTRRDLWDRGWTKLAHLHTPPAAAVPPPASTTAAPAPAAAAVPLPAACAGERWPVAVLTDAGASAVNAGQAKDATLAQLLALSRPATVDADPTVRAPAEHQVYRVQAKLTHFELLPDQDYRLDLADPQHTEVTLSAFIPAGKCTTSQDYSALFDELREDLTLRFAAGGPVSAVTVPDPPLVTVIGVAFFAPHPGRGNGFQLHPVLDFRVQ